MFEINYSQLIQYEILEKLVTYIIQETISFLYDSYLENVATIKKTTNKIFVIKRLSYIFPIF